MSEIKEDFVTGMSTEVDQEDLENVSTTATDHDNITVKMSDEEINEVVKAATEATPEEVLKMNHSIEDVSEIENELDVALMLSDASACNTIGDLVTLIEEEM